MKAMVIIFLSVMLSCLSLRGENSDNISVKKAPQPVVRYAGTPAGWWDDCDKALEYATEAKMPVLILFTGSDWCYWCQKLHDETLSSPEFKEKIVSSFVLVYVDFPRQNMTPERMEYVKGLFQKYCGASDGFPTTVIIDASGKVSGKISGFRPAADYVKMILK